MRPIVFAGLLAAAALPARAEDVTLQSLDGAVSFSGSYGITAIRANEYVYDGSKKYSELNWKSDYVSTLSAGVRVELPRAFYLRATGLVGFAGDGFMADYDWQKPGGPWSDRSQHPDTRLDHYYALGGEIGRTIYSRNGTELGLGAGFHYTDVQWSAWGGSYIYSQNGFRDARGHFDPDQKGISYRQAWPVPYLGADLSHSAGNWTFSGGLQAGLAVNAYDIDDHWVRSLRFYDYFETTPTVSLKASVDYRIRENISVYASGAFEQMFHTRADTKIVTTKNGKESWDYDAAGGDFRSALVSVGIKGRF